MVINDNDKCFTFNYTVYSKRDYEPLLLQTTFLPASVYVSNKSSKHDIYEYKDIINSQISDYLSRNKFGCIGYELLKTPIFIKLMSLHYQTVLQD